jgi:hypothetical protein
MERGDAKKPKQQVERRRLRKLLAAAALRAAAGCMIQQYAISDRHTCRLIEPARSMHRSRNRLLSVASCVAALLCAEPTWNKTTTPSKRSRSER